MESPGKRGVSETWVVIPTARSSMLSAPRFKGRGLRLLPGRGAGRSRLGAGGGCVADFERCTLGTPAWPGCFPKNGLCVVFPVNTDWNPEYSCGALNVCDIDEDWAADVV